MAILSVIPENPLLWTFLMENFNLGIAKMSVMPENPLFPNPVLPKTSVLLYITKILLLLQRVATRLSPLFLGIYC